MVAHRWINVLRDLRVLTLASLLGKLVYAVSSLAVLPFYVRLLGPEPVGLLGFFTSLLMVFMAIDGGLTSAITREIGSLQGLRTRSPRRYRLRLYAVANSYFTVFLLLGLLVGAIVIFNSDFLMTHWLNFNGISPTVVRDSICWMGVFIGLNLPVLIVQAALVGGEMQVEFNAMYVPYSLLRTLGALGFLYVIGDSANIEVFFAYQVAIQLFYLIALLVAFYRDDWKFALRLRPSLEHVRRGLRFGAGVLMISLSSAIVIQADKIYLSGALPLSDYGVYTIAITFASMPYIVSSALYAVLFPRFSASSFVGDSHRIYALYRSAFTGLALILVSMVLGVCWFSAYPLRLMFDEKLVSEISGVLPILMAGTAIQALLIVPFSLQLATGWTSLSLRINLIAIPLVVIFLPITVSRFKMNGAACVWLGYNLFAFVTTMYWMRRRFLYLAPIPSQFVKILALLLIITVPVFAVLHFWILPELSELLSVLCIALCGLLTLASAGMIFKNDLEGFS